MASGGEAGWLGDGAEDVSGEANEVAVDAPVDDASDSASDAAAGLVDVNVSAFEAAGSVELSGVVDVGEVAGGVATLFGPCDVLPPQPEIAISATNPQLSAPKTQDRITLNLLHLNRYPGPLPAGAWQTPAGLSSWRGMCRSKSDAPLRNAGE